MNNQEEFKRKIKESLESVRDFYSKNKNSVVFFAVIIAFFFIVALPLNFLFNPTVNFPENSVFTIEDGDSLSEVAEKMSEREFIKSPFWFRNLVIAFQGERGVMAGDYYFSSPESMFKISKRVTKGDYGLTSVRVTIPEGLNVFEIAEILEERFARFDPEVFLNSVDEGYLFPDTYFFLPNSQAVDIIKVMHENFEQKMSEIEEDLESSRRSLDEIINMASILETEARTTDTRKVISGILWKRLEIGMPLQVDVTFKYVNGKNTYELTQEDLKIDSPYNTYVYKGLPPTPIANPGMDSILAAIYPEETDYLYFLSDRSGNMYYSEDFEGHIENRQYLDN